MVVCFKQIQNPGCFLPNFKFLAVLMKKKEMRRVRWRRRVLEWRALIAEPQTGMKEVDYTSEEITNKTIGTFNGSIYRMKMHIASTISPA